MRGVKNRDGTKDLHELLRFWQAFTSSSVIGPSLRPHVHIHTQPVRPQMRIHKRAFPQSGTSLAPNSHQKPSSHCRGSLNCPSKKEDWRERLLWLQDLMKTHLRGFYSLGLLLLQLPLKTMAADRGPVPTSLASPTRADTEDRTYSDCSIRGHCSPRPGASDCSQPPSWNLANEDRAGTFFGAVTLVANSWRASWCYQRVQLT